MISSPRRDHPFRADHIGSLMRPPELVGAREAFERNEIDRARLAEVEDAAIREVVALQERLGLRSITDGEFRRRSYFLDFAESLGMEVVTDQSGSQALALVNKDGHQLPTQQGRVRRKLRRSSGFATRAFEFLKGATKQHPKVTLPAPTQLHFFAAPDGIDRSVYPDIEEFWADVIAVYHAELRALGSLGCTYVQIDETCLPKLCDPKVQASVAASGQDWRRLAEKYAWAVDQVIAGKPEGMEIGIHHCRGNRAGHWQAEGGYDLVADLMFNRIRAKAYYLEYDSPRAGDFRPLRLVPEYKMVVLGLLSTKEPALEKADYLKRRIDEAAKIVELERLCLSAQCGYSGAYKGHPLNADDQNRKIALTVAVARDVWGEA